MNNCRQIYAHKVNLLYIALSRLHSGDVADETVEKLLTHEDIGEVFGMEQFFADTMVYMNWEEIKEAGAKSVPILFPLGVIEEHGPHLPLGSDILWSTYICKEVRRVLLLKGKETLIAPPYYYGVNHCTGAFPGSFSLKPETFEQVLFEVFSNLKDFGFTEVYCFNYHGDPVHISSILNAIKRANNELGVKIKYMMEVMDLEMNGLQGTEDFLCVFAPQYKMEWFENQDESEQGLLDIHAGAFETGMIKYMYPDLVDTDKAKTLESYSLTYEKLGKWTEGGDSTVQVVPLGYAGNPRGYEAVAKIAKELIEVQVEAICTGVGTDER